MKPVEENKFNLKIPTTIPSVKKLPRFRSKLICSAKSVASLGRGNEIFPAIIGADESNSNL